LVQKIYLLLWIFSLFYLDIIECQNPQGGVSAPSCTSLPELLYSFVAFVLQHCLARFCYFAS